jgi:hypothetical protein
VLVRLLGAPPTGGTHLESNGCAPRAREREGRLSPARGIKEFILEATLVRL